MQIDYDSITIQAFKSFPDEPQTFYFSGKNPGLRFIEGIVEDEPEMESNGAGKSSIFDAVAWCLYGRTLDLLRNPDVIPWNGKGHPKVTVVLYRDNRRRRVTRTAKPNSLLLDGQETGQEEVERVVGCSFEVFSHTILLGQNQPLFFDLTAGKKMEVLATALNLDRWDGYSDQASDQVKDLNVKLTKFQSEFAEFTVAIEEAEGQQKKLTESAEHWAEENKDRSSKLAKELKALETRLPALLKKQTDADLARDSAGTELKDLDAKIARLRKQRDEAQNEYNKVDLAVRGLEEVAAALEQELAGLGARADTCPTCGQSLKGTALAQHKASLTAQIQRARAKVKAGVPRPVTEALEDAIDALEAAVSKADEFQEKADAAQTTLNVVTPDIVQLQTTIRHLKEEQQRKADEVNPFRQNLNDLKKKIRNMNEDLDDIERDVKTTETDIARANVWVKGFKEVRLQQLEEVLQELELATNALLPESGLRDWQVRYDIERETKKGTIQSGLTVVVLSPRNKEAVKWENFSGGERHRLRVVGALALSEVLLSHAGVQTNLQVLDEPTKDLSNRGVQDLCEYLSNRAVQLDKDIWFIDHMAVASTHFTEVVTITRTADGSFIDR